MCKIKKTENMNNQQSNDTGKNNNKYGFQKLTPIHDAAIDTYSDALDFVFQEDDLRNIAITGTYGSGKSSVIETYEKQHKEFKFIHLSLSHFDNTDLQDNDIETEEKHIRTIEGQLINQLVYQIPKECIPETQFSIKQDKEKKKYKIIAAAVCVFIFLSCYFNYYTKIKEYIPQINNEWLKTFLQLFLHPDFLVVGIVLMLWLLGFGIYRLLYYVAGKKFIHKISVHGNEIELFSNDKDSFFDKYLDEILYLFEHSGVNGVIIEDIDRFNNTLVFERLREINTLLHERQKLSIESHSKPIRFFYLVRDDLFNNNDNKDRTKFFDFVIPIVPVVDSSNSYDMLSKYLKEANLLERFDKKFLRHISLYIDDLRILKNIYNEFRIYNAKLNTIDLNYNKILAIVTYKNIFPYDFADLQLNRGFVHALFEAKKSLIMNRVNVLKKERDEINEDIKLLEKEPAKSLGELDILNNHFLSRLTGPDRKNWMEVEYPKRHAALESVLSSSIEELKQMLKQNEDEIKKVKYSCLSDLLIKSNIESVLKGNIAEEIWKDTFKSTTDSQYFPLLKYLLTNGFIDESYSDYMSVFYTDSLTVGDKKYTRHVLERNESSYDYIYHLDNPELIMEFLSDFDFTHKESLNFDLFDYLLANRFTAAVSNNIALIRSDNNFAFIEQYICSRKQIDLMVAAFVREWPGLFKIAHDEDKLSPEALLIFSRKIVEMSDDDTFKDSDEWNTLRDYISNDPTYIQRNMFVLTETHDSDKEVEVGSSETKPQIDNNPVGIMIKSYDIEKMKLGLKRLQVSFVAINKEIASKELLDFVYVSRLYQINANNVELMLEEECNVTYDNNFMSRFMTFVLITQDNLFCDYMIDNIDTAMDVYLEMYDGVIIDDSDIIVSVLNNEEVSDDNKEQYIKRLTSAVKQIDEVKADYHESLLMNNAVEYTIDNILFYYGDKSLDDVLISFINSGTGRLNISEATIASIRDRFVEDCVICNGLDDDKYRKIVQDNEPYAQFKSDGLSANHMSVLIKLNKIEMNKSNLTFIRAHYPDQVYEFIVENMEEYLQLVRIGESNTAEIRGLLEHGGLGIQYKKQLVDLCNTYISIKDLTLSESIKDYILTTNKVDIGDLPWLMMTYKNASPTTAHVFNMVKNHMFEAKQHASSMCAELRKKVFNSDEIERNDKIEIFEKTVKDMNNDEIISSLRGLGAIAIADNLKGEDVKVTNNTDNTKILSALESKGIIQTLSEDMNCYRRIRFVDDNKK